MCQDSLISNDKHWIAFSDLSKMIWGDAIDINSIEDICYLLSWKQSENIVRTESMVQYGKISQDIKLDGKEIKQKSIIFTERKPERWTAEF